MTDAVVSFLLENLSRLIEDELNLLSGVKDKVISLSNELRFINIFLKNSMGKRSDEFVNEVVNQIRDVAFKAEDVIDIYAADIARQKCRNVVGKLFHMKQHVMVLHEVDAEIEKIKNRIQEIYDNREKYGITQGESTSEEATVAATAAAAALRERRKDVEEKDVVGLMHDSTHLIQQLMEGDTRRKVLGKTTLARKIYNNDQVKKFFPNRAWGYVSNDYRPTEFWSSLLKSLLSKSEYDDIFNKKPDKDEDEVDFTSEEKLKMKVAECLKGKKYLIVLDDIWKIEVWKKIQNVFPDDDDCFSRILLSSCEMEVANYAGTTSPYHLPFLNKQESWELFSKKVFRGKECPSDLEPLGRSIAESCKGFPLTIVVLAGLVAKKEISQREWTRIKGITWHLTKDKIEATEILKLSNDSLPQRLKPCFLYFGIYPKDDEIKAREMIQMWIAEGFIQPHEAGIPSATEQEDIAYYYLDELVDRSLVQVAKRKSDGGVKTCRIHDLLRDFCISESKSYKFMEVCTKPNNMESLSIDNPRRLSIHCKVLSDATINNFNQFYRRSSFFFAEEKKKCREDFLKCFKLARVLYFKSKEASSFLFVLYAAGGFHPSLPSIEWNMMIHLRYLRVDGYFGDIPDSICSLWNLETLDVKYAKKVSSKIWMLKRLKHLYIKNSRKVANLPKSQTKINENLETLCLGGDGGAGAMMSILKNNGLVFTRLRKLVFQLSRDGPMKHLPGLEHLSNLQSLKVNFGWVRLSPDSIVFPPNLTKITLKSFEALDLKILFINLQILKLRKVSIWGESNLNFGAGLFPQLQFFQMREIGFIRSWRLEEGAMPSLRHLVIHGCENLDELPQQLWSLTTLRQVHVLKPTRKLARSLQNVELKNGCELIVSND